MIFKESTLKEMEYRYVKEKIFVAQSQAFCTIGSMHINVERKDELDSTEFGLVSLGFSFTKNRDGRGNGLEGKEFVRKTTRRLSYE